MRFFKITIILPLSLNKGNWLKSLNQLVKTVCLLLLLLWQPLESYSQSRPFVTLPSQLEHPDYADWIAPNESRGVFYFRKSFELDRVPGNFVVHVSGDARYRLYVNGQKVCRGPAVGDVENWNHETVDIAPYLEDGNNIIASQVWNWQSLNGARQQSVGTAFILQGNSSVENIVNTNATWKVFKDPGYHALPMTSEIAGGGYIAGATDSIVGELHPWGWNGPDFDDDDWEYANEKGKGNHGGLDTWKGTPWKLKKRSLPFMEQKKERIPDVVKKKGVRSYHKNSDKLKFEVPANQKAEVLLDNRVLTMGFPRLHLSGGKGARVKIQYQEALFDEEGNKGNRDLWEGKSMKGIYDVFMPDGGDRWFEPLWLRTFRYVKITIETGSDPLHVHDFFNLFTAYPLEEKASFETSDDNFSRIWEASWRTARLCALESYWDCPYYEQVQYIGDTRIQALISMYVDGDDRLARNAIEQFYGSMQPMGLTKSAHPTNGVQIIPPYSLLFIGMIHDYHMMRDDPEFIRQFVPGIKFILEWFINKVNEEGIMGPLPYWNHIDGGTGFSQGSPPGISEGGSAHMTILLAYALDRASDLLDAFDYECDVTRFGEMSASLKKNVMEQCYSSDRQLIAETPDKKEFSQHTNIFAVLTDVFQPVEQKEIMNRVLNDGSLIQTTLYFKFYLFRALKKTGMGDEVVDLMDEWEYFLDNGLTTFPEHGLNSRSDCHAWSAHPLLAALNVIAGIEPGTPGFKTVEIRPSTAAYSHVTASMLHPAGNISFKFSEEEGKDTYDISLPGSIRGVLLIDDKEYPLKSGENLIKH